MQKVPHSGKYEGNTQPVGGVYNFIIPDRATGGDNIFDIDSMGEVDEILGV